MVVVLAHVGGSRAEIAAANAEAAQRQTQQSALQAEAKKRDVETAHLNAEAQRNLEHHHRFAVAVTLFQVAIGLAAIAALLRRPPLWSVSMAAGGARRWPSPTASPWSCDRAPQACHRVPVIQNESIQRGVPLGRVAAAVAVRAREKLLISTSQPLNPVPVRWV